MKKWLKSIAASIMIAVIAVTSVAPTTFAVSDIDDLPDVYEDAIISGDFAYILNVDKSASIVGYVGSKTAISIPSKIDEYTVRSLETFIGVPQADPKMMRAESISIPATITRINFQNAPFAFLVFIAKINVSADNKNFKSISGVLYNKKGTTLLSYPPSRNTTTFTVPSGVTSIGASAFERNVQLEGIKLNSKLKTIGDSAFAFSGVLEKITIPKNILTVGEMAFADCGYLRTVEFASGVKKIKKNAFSSCEKLKKVTIPKSVTTLEKDIFLGSSRAVVYCYTGSKADKYVRKNRVKYELKDFTGLKRIKNKTYFYKNGKVAKKQWCKLSSKKYYYTDSKGLILKKKWKTIKKRHYYLDEKGIRVMSKKVTIGKKTYKFNSKGVCTNRK